MDRILIIAYHFPPINESSGVHRTLNFAKYLPDDNIEPIVLTISPKAYIRISKDGIDDSKFNFHIKRAFGLDTARHLSFFGRYPGLLALPDRWSSWVFGGVFSGLRLARRFKPRVIFSTYPIATAHLIGFLLHKITRLPWVADFRDSMTEEGYPANKLQWKIYRWIERKTVYNAKKIIFTTSSAIRMYAVRYPDIPGDRWFLIPNGYDEEEFIALEKERAETRNEKETKLPLRFVHSGLLYPSERDPSQFFSAISALKKEGVISSDTVQIIMRASGNEDEYSQILKSMSIDDIIQLAPPVDYKLALMEMMDVDSLLIFQAANCNHQIPAKIYEYLRAGKPILALTDPDGDTASVLREAGIDTIVRLDDEQEIKRMFVKFFEQVKTKTAQLPDEHIVKKYSRRIHASELAKLLKDVINN